MMRLPHLGLATLTIAFTVSVCASHARGVDRRTPIYDVVILGGRVIDPASGDDRVANLGIRGGKIALITTEGLKGTIQIDAKGLVVAPGFIDLHAHGQHETGQRFQVMDGVTTAIDAEAGAMPLRPYLAKLSGKSYVNFGASASHLCARAMVIARLSCGGHPASDPQVRLMHDRILKDATSLIRPSTAEQEAAILMALDDTLAEGALGFGLGVEYTPGAARKEIFDIFKAAAAVQAPVFVHVRQRPIDAAPGVPVAVAQEVIADAIVTGAPLQLVHVHSTGLGFTSTILEMIAQARARGFDITSEVYPYTAGSTSLGSQFFAPGWQERSGIDYGDLQWAATGERLTKESFERYRESEPTGAVIIHMIPETAVEAALADPNISIASDGMAWLTNGEHPRGAGTFSRVLGRYVRDRNLLPLHLALAKMTIMPARRLEAIAPAMRGKGRIQQGADADITIFDPNTIIDHATFERPMQYSTGVRHVIVNGQPVVRDGKLIAGRFPGQAILSRFRKS